VLQPSGMCLALRWLCMDSNKMESPESVRLEAGVQPGRSRPVSPEDEAAVVPILFGTTLASAGIEPTGPSVEPGALSGVAGPAGARPGARDRAFKRFAIASVVIMLVAIGTAVGVRSWRRAAHLDERAPPGPSAGAGATSRATTAAEPATPEMAAPR
jgi:hypothetical protein